MTRLFEEAIAEARKLPEPAQDAIASLILDEIGEDRDWDESFARSQDMLSWMARKACEDIAAGRVRGLKTRES